jgi:hypothetical protein
MPVWAPLSVSATAVMTVSVWTPFWPRYESVSAE